MQSQLSSVDELLEKLKEADYISDRAAVAPVFLSIKMEKPLLVEGPPGCGKTQIAKTISQIFGLDLVRLQCYEGLDYSNAVYEWDYQRQLLEIKLGHDRELRREEIRHEIYSENFLLERPLLRSIRSKERKVLLIDEIDRADPEFEGFLLEFLSEFQISIPELGTLKAKSIPYVFITSNKTRELSDALKRRCLYLSIGYPSKEMEIEILKRKVPGIDESLATEVSDIASRIRKDAEIARKPGTAESIDLAASVLALGEISLSDERVLRSAIGAMLKDEEDLARFLEGLERRLES